MAQVLPPRLNVGSCSGEVFPPPDVPLGPTCALKWTHLLDECGAEEARTALVASCRHASRTFVCPFKQCNSSRNICLKTLNRIGGACNHLHYWNIVEQASMTITSNLLLPYRYPISISALPKLFYFQMHRTILSPTSSLGCGGCCETMRQPMWQNLKHIVTFSSHLLCMPWRRALPFQSPAESNSKRKNNHVRVNPDKTEQAPLGRGKHV